MALPSVNRRLGWPVWRRVLAPLAWAAAIVVAARVPALVRLAPVLDLVRGPLALVLAAVAAVVALAALEPLPPPPRLRAPILFALGWGFLLVVGLAYCA